MKSMYIVIVALFNMFFLSCGNTEPLPIYNHKPVADFRFLNQDSLPITNETFKNKIYIADFFFTSCNTVCPGMHRAMKEIYNKYQSSNELMLLSHTIDYKYDVPSKLKQYSKKLGVYGPMWQFAYGTKDKIYSIARSSYLSTVFEDKMDPQNFVHQGYLLLVDKNRLLRGAYDSSDEKQVKQLEQDIERLLKE